MRKSQGRPILLIFIVGRPSDAFSFFSLPPSPQKNRHAPLTKIRSAQCGTPKFNGVPEAQINPKGMGIFK